jgi:hypothetical protein
MEQVQQSRHQPPSRSLTLHDPQPIPGVMPLLQYQFVAVSDGAGKYDAGASFVRRGHGYFAVAGARFAAVAYDAGRTSAVVEAAAQG